MSSQEKNSQDSDKQEEQDAATPPPTAPRIIPQAVMFEEGKEPDDAAMVGSLAAADSFKDSDNASVMPPGSEEQAEKAKQADEAKQASEEEPDEPYQVNDEVIGSEKDRVMGVATSGTHGLREDLVLPKPRLGRPFIRGQMSKYQDTVHLDHVKNFVYDMSDAQDVAKLDALDTRHVDIDGGLQITQRESKFIETLGTWKVFLTVAYYRFDPIIR